MGIAKNGSWSGRFAQAFTDPGNQQSRKRVDRDSWEQLKFAKGSRQQIEHSPWWRATKPGRRVVSRLKRSRSRSSRVEPERLNAERLAAREQAIVRRINDVLARLGHESAGDDDFETSFRRLGAALTQNRDQREFLWYTFVAIVGRYPFEDDLSLLDSDTEVHGADHALDGLLVLNARRAESWSLHANIRFVDNVMVDVSVTARIDMQTGIQRVVRETVSRWVSQHSVTLVMWDQKAGTFRSVQPDEHKRVTEYSPTRETNKLATPSTKHAEIVAPLGTTVVVPEVSNRLQRSLALGAVATWTSSTLSSVFYDFIGQSMPEAINEQGRIGLSNYMPVLRASSRISAISETAGQEIRAFSETLPGVGLPVPEVRAQLLPTVAPELAHGHTHPEVSDLVASGDGPLIVSVSRIEPRKNQVTILRAAAALWDAGLEFQLLFIGWNSTSASAFNAELELLQQQGRPVTLIQRGTEDLVWSAYREARFSVFISLAEGFGLPVTESLTLGTPVVLSNFGSMAEIGSQGGVAFVDPRDVRAVRDAMRLLLTDDEAYSKLCHEAATSDFGSWDAYAEATWAWLVEGTMRA